VVVYIENYQYNKEDSSPATSIGQPYDFTLGYR
jgi:hypothetical protein